MPEPRSGPDSHRRPAITTDISDNAVTPEGDAPRAPTTQGDAPASAVAPVAFATATAPTTKPTAPAPVGSGTRRVYLVDGARTPYLKARTGPGPFTPVDLAVQAGRLLLARQPFPSDAFDDVILGCVNVHPDEVNPGRVAALRLGCGAEVPGWSVQRNCASGMQSIDIAFKYIAAGHGDLILAGGTEALSHAPLLYKEDAVRWFGGLNSAKSLGDKLAQIGKFRPGFFSPSIGILRGLTDPVVKLNMGQTAERLAHQFGISREQADAYALESHQRIAKARAEGWLSEVEPMIAPDGTVYDHDDGVRPDNTLEQLASLKPVFEPPFGRVTAGNSSQITDGGSWTIIASEAAVEKYGLKPMARIVDCVWEALDPSVMGLGPVLSATALLQRNDLKRDDIGAWELNEAFAAQVLACLAAWRDKDFCRDILGLPRPFGAIDRSILNVDGGAISIGHPVGSSGNRITLHLAHVMQRLGARHGVATECVGGGLGGAMLLELVE
ncbi:acetyl-CoA C-acetyltransferase [Rhodoligotrophos ferricapiens]|uniref:acetyl-CoA C-acetyltransferase n=1 Tax=Rhodoligotrophos ferricapiens TaxID=3069264 RepID=UPI00315D1E7F